jgi:hypothetical protein
LSTAFGLTVSRIGLAWSAIDESRLYFDLKFVGIANYILAGRGYVG